MLSRLGGFTPNHPQRAGNQRISLSVYRATFSAALRDSGATETSISSGAVDQTAQLSGVIPDQESSTYDSPAEHLPKESQTSGAVTLEKRPSLPAATAAEIKGPAEKRTAVNLSIDPAEKENDLDQKSSTTGLPPEHRHREGLSPRAVTLEEREPFVATSSERGKTAAGGMTAVDHLKDPTKQGAVLDQESSAIGSPAEHLPRESRPVVAVNLRSIQPLLGMPSGRGETVAKGRTAVNPSIDIIKQQKPRLRLTLRPPPRVAYPETIDVDLPDSFTNNHGTYGAWSKCNEKQCDCLWQTEVVAPLPAGWNPNILILRHLAPSRSQEISTRCHQVNPKLLGLAVELRLQILRYLLKSALPITDPHVDCPYLPQKKSIPTLHPHVLRACRRMYLEGSSILYHENTFRFTNWASWFTFQTSQFSIHQTGIRHLEIHTTVAEKYLNCLVHVQGQFFQDWRIRGPMDWDWAFSYPWRFSSLRTLKLALKDFHRLPEVPPANTPHFCPDPMTTQGRDELLTKIYVIRHILSSCQTPKLQDLTIVGISNPRYILMLEIHFLTNTCLEVERDYTRHERMVRYLENRTEGRWETQSERASDYWELTHVCREKRIRQGWQPESLLRDYCLPGLDAWHLALLMWIRTRAAKHGRNDPPVWKLSSILWTW